MFSYTGCRTVRLGVGLGTDDSVVRSEMGLGILSG